MFGTPKWNNGSEELLQLREKTFPSIGCIFIISRLMNHGVAITGPIFVVRESEGNRERAIVDWGYNAWGGKYPPYDLDDAIPKWVSRLRNLPLFSPKMVLEGGSIT